MQNQIDGVPSWLHKLTSTKLNHNGIIKSKLLEGEKYDKAEVGPSQMNSGAAGIALIKNIINHHIRAKSSLYPNVQGNVAILPSVGEERNTFLGSSVSMRNRVKRAKGRRHRHRRRHHARHHRSRG